MTALVQAAIARYVAPPSDLSVVAIFSLIGLTVSVVAMHFGFVFS